MPATSDGRQPVPVADDATFSVERFGWGAPDRLVVAGTFSGLAGAPSGEVVLTVIGEDGPHRLPAVQQGADDGRWTAEFAWLEAPVAFDRARLELGSSLSVELPADADGPVPVVRADAGATAPHPASDPAGAADKLRLEARLLEESETLEQERARALQAEEALARAQADLAAERERRAADAERFREGLATVRGSAEVAIAAATEARTEAEERARAEIAALQERIAALEPAGEELERTRGELAGAQAALADARAALAAARGSAQELLDRLSDHATEGR
jgi:hypothetical protein